MSESLGFPKPKIVKDQKYLAWVRTLPCVSCEKLGVVPKVAIWLLQLIQPNHLDRDNDRSAIPHCFYHHRIYHDKGKSLWKKLLGYTQTELWELTVIFNERYENEQNH